NPAGAPEPPSCTAGAAITPQAAIAAQLTSRFTRMFIPVASVLRLYCLWQSGRGRVEAVRARLSVDHPWRENLLSYWFGSGVEAGVTVRLTGGLETPPTVTTTGWLPQGASAGTAKLICVTPTRPGGVPVKITFAGIPPTVTETASRGLGSSSVGVPAAGE